MRTSDAKSVSVWTSKKSGLTYAELDGIENGWVLYTPDLAQKILDGRNERNRPIRNHKVANNVRDMVNDEWMINGESVVFDYNGNLIDGQHRLTAVVGSNTEQWLMTVWGIPPASQSTFDTGAARQTRDTYYMDGLPKTISSHLAATVNRIITMDRLPGYTANKSLEVTHSENRAFTAANPDVLEAAQVSMRVQQLKLPWSPSGTGAAYFHCARVDRDLAKEFFSQLVEGTMLMPGQPVKALRDRFENAERLHKRKTGSAETYAWIIWAWNLTRKGQTAERLSGPKGGFTDWPMPR